MKSYFDALQVNYALNLFINQIDAPGEIEEHPSTLNEAFRLGRELVASDTPPSEKPIDVTLT
jgi:hypothetical protein